VHYSKNGCLFLDGSDDDEIIQWAADISIKRNFDAGILKSKAVF